MQTSSGMRLVARPPIVTLIVLVGCLVGFVVALAVGTRDLPEFLLNFGVVPAGVVAYFAGAEGATFVNSLLPFVSSLFLHGGFIHLLANVFTFWMVGDMVEAWLGATRYATLFVFGAIAELIVRMGVSGPSQIASVGISGGVAAVIGGYVVILLKIRAKDEPRAAAAILLRRLPLIVVAVAWFPLQYLTRYFPLAATCQTAEPVAWPALAASGAVGVFLLSLSAPRGGRFLPESEPVAPTVITSTFPSEHGF